MLRHKYSADLSLRRRKQAVAIIAEEAKALIKVKVGVESAQSPVPRLSKDCSMHYKNALPLY